MKKSKKPFARYSALKTFLRMPQNKASRSEIIPTLTTIFTNFFVLQQKQKFQITDIHVQQVCLLFEISVSAEISNNRHTCCTCRS